MLRHLWDYIALPPAWKAATLAQAVYVKSVVSVDKPREWTVTWTANLSGRSKWFGGHIRRFIGRLSATNPSNSVSQRKYLYSAVPLKPESKLIKMVGKLYKQSIFQNCEEEQFGVILDRKQQSLCMHYNNASTSHYTHCPGNNESTLDLDKG